MKKFLIASIIATTIVIAQAKADTIVFYSFNDTSDGTNTAKIADIGSGISSFDNYNDAGSPLTLLSSVSGNPNNHGFSSGNSVSQNNWNGNAYFQFTLDSTGYQDIILAWGGNVSSTGPQNTTIMYSSTGVGGAFTSFGTVLSAKNLTIVPSVDLSSITALDNNPNVVIRLYGVDASNTNSGTMKIDNFSIDATVIPEPSTIFLVGMSLAGLLAIRRRR